ncbi:conserved hypothetical protein [Microsporum canis CBS 113480]|uniref:Rhodopsin domain-containing protein n=1 Tax=Arthroderma otae (strain ATCC MYA-4605 / CBS 113480) TaxID=554155 RepID=C5FXV4_ARTOC|nr:conserved hypothetical protein [Microsporum canis CBS 113480]EEQ34352.1 conserved hypothetical protein [Microsporum canis CBS 113480]
MRPSPEIVASWPKPNYVDPEYQGPQLVIVTLTFCSLSYIVVVLRMYVRLRIKKNAGWDDWLIVATLPFAAALTASNIIGVYHGWGKIRQILIYSAVLLMFEPEWKAIIFGITDPNGARLLGRPLSNYWKDPLRRNCIDNNTRIISGSVPHIVTDIIIWAIPIPTLYRMYLPRREKVVLILIMSLGLVACAAAVIRLGYTYVYFYITYDYTWVGYNLWIWLNIETNLAVICASLPILRPLARKYVWESASGESSDPGLPMETQPVGQRAIQELTSNQDSNIDGIVKTNLEPPPKVYHPVKEQS